MRSLGIGELPAGRMGLPWAPASPHPFRVAGGVPTSAGHLSPPSATRAHVAFRPVCPALGTERKDEAHSRRPLGGLAESRALVSLL